MVVQFNLYIFMSLKKNLNSFRERERERERNVSEDKSKRREASRSSREVDSFEFLL